MSLQGDYEPSSSDWVREQVERIVKTGTTEGVLVQDRPIVLLTYRGASSGKIRKTPVMRVEHDGQYAAVASLGGAPKNPQWYSSFVGGAVVELQDGTASGEYRAREITGDEKTAWWDRAVEAYPPYADYQEKTDRVIPVFVLEPVS
ncbi:MAG TPA: nitroreductase family deazaflavin-dependent oxidoreductase [Pseudonocardia sp.]|jgi:deazaflavin-dependent oxidoreductase (nitroreductase family)|nr:nitroreductase family deazaflavin-dependent oxidoreductase [Pseudonocardia sp.]